VIRNLRPEIKAGLQLHFKGKGWREKFDGLIFRGASFFGGDKPEEWYSGTYYGVEAHDWGSEDAKSYPPFYDKLDYYLICSIFEGGPMGLLEALATGLPIISSEVGWVPEFKRIAHLYPAGCVDALAVILTEIAERKLLRRAEVESMSYKQYASDVLTFFEKLRGLK
jgi:glycosyltransferase involved in cell wall biosynthesis